LPVIGAKKTTPAALPKIAPKKTLVFNSDDDSDGDFNAKAKATPAPLPMPVPKV
jgi:hypothetical protein